MKLVDAQVYFVSEHKINLSLVQIVNLNLKIQIVMHITITRNLLCSIW